MTTSRRASDFMVGATVLVVTIVVITAVLWLKQTDFRGKTRHLVVRSRDVGGVALGNPVVIRGVRSGQVASIALGERGWVVLTLGIDRDVTLPSDPVVLLAASSLFGEWQATITDATGLPADRELRAAISESRTSGDTLAGAVLPDIAQLTTVAGRIAGDVAQVADRVQVAFDDQAARELRESLRNFFAALRPFGQHGAAAVKEPRPDQRRRAAWPQGHQRGSCEPARVFITRRLGWDGWGERCPRPTRCSTRRTASTHRRRDEDSEALLHRAAVFAFRVRPMAPRGRHSARPVLCAEYCARNPVAFERLTYGWTAESVTYHSDKASQAVTNLTRRWDSRAPRRDRRARGAHVTRARTKARRCLPGGGGQAGDRTVCSFDSGPTPIEVPIPKDFRGTV